MKMNTMQLTNAGLIAELQPAQKRILELEEGGSKFPGNGGSEGNRRGIL